MRQPLADLRHSEWQILSTYVRLQGGPRGSEQEPESPSDPSRSPEAPPPTEGRSDYACSDLRPRLHRSPGTRPDD